MPLDEYIKDTMEGLRKGDAEISAGMASTALKRFEEGKVEFAQAMFGHRNDW
jgi:hypothetical protein